MDTTVFESLRAALRASPGNRDLGLVVVRAALERNLPDEIRGVLGELALDDSDAEVLLVKARAYCRVGELDQGRTAYRAAIDANPALEDRALEAELNSKVVRLDFARQGGNRKVAQEANDDTDATEVARLLLPEVERVKFVDVGGLDEVKKQIYRRIILPFQKPSLFQRFRRKAGGGILLYGPPGCGKTLIARATAGECGAKFFNVGVSDVLDMYIGESERKLHALFEQARQSSPAVLFFDEVEALGGKRQYSREATSSKLVSQFLSELDGFAQNNDNVLVMGATNVPWAVDPAFRRPGRFDRVMFVPPPDKVARASILESLLKDRPVVGEIKCREMAELTPGFSGADLRNLVESAVDEAIEASISSGREMPVAAEHLRAALKNVRSTTNEWLTTARNYARYSNEAGQYDEVLEFLEKHGNRK